MRARDLSLEIVESCLMCYARKYIPGVSRSSRKPSSSSIASESDQRELLETIISNLPLEKSSRSVTSTRFLFGLMRTANILNASEPCKAARFVSDLIIGTVFTHSGSRGFPPPHRLPLVYSGSNDPKGSKIHPLWGTAQLFMHPRYMHGAATSSELGVYAYAAAQVKKAIEGPTSKNPLSFKWYNAEEVILGKKMKDWMRFSVAFWHTFCGTGGDPFGAPTQFWPWEDGTNSVAMAKRRMRANFEFINKLGVEFWCFHDRDIAPDGKTLEETNRNLMMLSQSFGSPCVIGEQARKVRHSHHEDERASSLAKEFERVAEEAEQECASQTVDKAPDE